ncbi:universal stress protein [Streptomyces sp. NPDC048643]|uniref:universal stress protein n=1 Tax=Streptomyces sp. NPDC048643 TaxID=3155637 RepID=UPI00341CE0A6
MATRQVVVGVDGSLPAVRALDRASEQAELRGAALTIVYAVSDADIAGPVLTSSASRVRERHPGLTFRALAVVDSPVRALARHGRDAELTVVGSRGLGGIAGLIAGSVSRRLASRTHSPLLVVRGGYTAPEGEVLLWPSGDTSVDAAAFAFSEAERRESPLHVLPARATPYTITRRRAPAPDDGTLGPSGGRRPDTLLGDTGVAECHLGPARPTGHALLDSTFGAALVVVGVPRRPHRPGGGAGRALLLRSHCPVVIVPEDGTS